MKCAWSSCVSIEAKPENLIGDRAYDSDPLDDTLRQDGIEMIGRTAPTARNHRPKTDAACVASYGVGSSSGSSPGSNGNAASLCVGSFIQRTSSDSYRRGSIFIGHLAASALRN